MVIPLSHYIYILNRNADKSQCFLGLSYIITNVSHSNIQLLDHIQTPAPWFPVGIWIEPSAHHVRPPSDVNVGL